MAVDKKLIKNCLKNDRRSQNELYKELFSFLMNICIRYKSNYDDAGAALNTIYLKVLKGLETYNHDKAMLPWVKTIAVRHLIDEYRSERRHEAVALDDVPSYSVNGYSVSQDKLNVDDILSMLAKLPINSRSVFNLFVLDGYKHKEIADMLGMSEGNSKWHLNQARTQLQQMITHERNRTEKIRLAQ